MIMDSPTIKISQTYPSEIKRKTKYPSQIPQQISLRKYQRDANKKIAKKRGHNNP
mgnify:CR=1 FL=1